MEDLLIKKTNREMVINKQKKLKQIKDEFQEQFPFLKLEFYSGFYKQGEGSDKKTMLANDLTIGEVCKLTTEEIISISESMKVSELEKAFKDIFGLSVQVFRKSNNLWLQTTITDGWSLEKQNQNAKEMNVQENLNTEPNDYHEQE
jgi:hypothetical protein